MLWSRVHVATFQDASWDLLQQLRGGFDVGLSSARSLAAAGQQFTGAIASVFSTVVLARVYWVGALGALPVVEQTWASDFAKAHGCATPLSPKALALCLLGTSGIEPRWNQREASVAHRAIPLVERRMVDDSPMLGAMLAASVAKLGWERDDAAIQLRAMTGGLNNRFLVEDARSAIDARGRAMLAAQDFVSKHAIRSVFGMGGTYVAGSVAIFIAYTRESLTPRDVDRFSSFISTFKLATAELVTQSALFTST